MNPLEKLPSDKLFDQLSGAFGNYFIESLVNSKNKRASNLAMLLAIAILAYAGVEAVKVIFRKNFGIKGVNIFRLILSTIAFIIIGAVAYTFYAGFDNEAAKIGSQMSFLATSIFYFLLAVYILIKGFSSKSKTAIDPNYRGDSSILGFLMKGEKGWKQSRVQNLAEPLSLLAIGIFLSAVNLFWGLPLVFCAISVWAHLAMEAIMGLVPISDLLSNAGYEHSKNNTFSQVLKH